MPQWMSAADHGAVGGLHATVLNMQQHLRVLHFHTAHILAVFHAGHAQPVGALAHSLPLGFLRQGEPLIEVLYGSLFRKIFTSQRLEEVSAAQLCPCSQLHKQCTQKDNCLSHLFMFDLSLFVYCIIYFPWRDVFCDFRLQRYGGLTKQMFQNRKMISFSGPVVPTIH